MKPRHKRAAIIVGGLASISLAAYFVLNAFQSNLVFFFTPSQVDSGEAPKNRTFRIGGMVKVGSIKRDNLTVSFVVTDTGIGIPKDLIPLIFDKFRQLDGSPARNYEGTGLGLTISKNLVELLGGKIEVESEVGRGSTFKVTIPVTSN